MARPSTATATIVVFHVVDVTAGRPATPTSRRKDFLSNATRDALYADFIDGLRDEVGIKINQQALSTGARRSITAQ